MRRLLGSLLATIALAGTVRAQDFIICKKCLEPAVSDTSSSPGYEAQGRNEAFVNAHLMLVFVGADHRARFAQWTAAGWSIESVDGVNRAAGLAMDFDDTGLPIASYHDSLGGVVFARRNGAAWDVQTSGAGPAGTLPLTPVGTFGHGGRYGTYGFVDPKHDLVGVFMIQREGGSDERVGFMEMAEAAVE